MSPWRSSSWRATAGGLVIAGVMSGAALAQSPSLAEVARDTSKRLAETSTAAPVFTNADLRVDVDVAQNEPAQTREATPEPSPPVPSTAEGGTAAEPAPGDEDAAVLVPGEDGRGESYWRGRADAIRSRLERARADAAGLGARAEALRANPDAPVGGLKEGLLQRAEADVKWLDAEWQRFEALARATGIPASWIQ